jgi:ribonuclease T2
MPQLLYNWPNILVGSSYDSFWEHEWTKHGTCSTQKTEHDYFATALSLYQTFNVTYQALRNSGIIPSSTDTYEIDKILYALSTAYKVKPVVVCEYDESLGQYLEEVVICLDKTFKPFDCDPEEKPTCWPNQSIKYFATFDKD